MLAKQGQDPLAAGPLKQRPVSVASVLYRDYANIRYQHLCPWMESWIHPNFPGGVPGGDCKDLTLEMGLDLEEAASAEEVAGLRGHSDVEEWLYHSRDWCTPLHHLELLDARNALVLLRAGAPLDLASIPGRVTPLQRAEQLLRKDDAARGGGGGSSGVGRALPGRDAARLVGDAEAAARSAMRSALCPTSDDDRDGRRHARRPRWYWRPAPRQG